MHKSRHACLLACKSDCQHARLSLCIHDVQLPHDGPQVDLLYLHNPAEMQLSALGMQAFMQRLREAFQWGEGARRRGLIRAYGLATWDCFRKPPGSPGYLSLLRLVQLAQQVGGPDHGLRSALPCF